MIKNVWSNNARVLMTKFQNFWKSLNQLTLMRIWNLAVSRQRLNTGQPASVCCDLFDGSNHKREWPNVKAHRCRPTKPSNLTGRDGGIRCSTWLGCNFLRKLDDACFLGSNSYQYRQYQTECGHKETNIGKIFRTLLSVQESNWFFYLFICVVVALCLYGMIR